MDLNPRVARHYDEVDPFYRRLWGEHLHHGLWERGDESADEAVVALALRVARDAGLTPQSRAHVVDIGCGYGGTARLLHDRFGAAVTGVTLSAVQHGQAESMTPVGADVRYVLGDWLESGLPADAFDAAIAIESTEHMEDKPAVFAEAARVLRRDGRLVVCAWLASPHATARQHRHLLEPIVTEGRLAALDTADDYGRWLGAAGFEDVHADDVSTQVSRTWTLCARRMMGELRRAEAWRYLLDRRNTERIFAITVVRMMLAFRTGCLRYAIFTARRR